MGGYSSSTVCSALTSVQGFVPVNQGINPSACSALLRNEYETKGVLMDLNVEVQKVGEFAVLVVSGEVDVFTAPKVREQLIDLVEQGDHHLVVSLEGVDFLDSTGLGVLVAGLKRVKMHEGTLSVVCTKDKILKIFRITGLTKVFPIHDSIEAATSSGPHGTE
jgi:anti-sigma B factor antagonist